MREEAEELKEPFHAYESPMEAFLAHAQGRVDLQARINVRLPGGRRLRETRTRGRKLRKHRDGNLQRLAHLRRPYAFPQVEARAADPCVREIGHGLTAQLEDHVAVRLEDLPRLAE